MTTYLKAADHPGPFAARIEPADVGAGEWHAADLGFASDRHRAERVRRHRLARRSSKHSVPLGKPRTWLQGDPLSWRGRKIRHRKTRIIYTVRQVFKSGRVELQKSFMFYLTNVKAIQKDYETYY